MESGQGSEVSGQAPPSPFPLPLSPSPHAPSPPSSTYLNAASTPAVRRSSPAPSKGPTSKTSSSCTLNRSGASRCRTTTSISACVGLWFGTLAGLCWLLQLSAVGFKTLISSPSTVNQHTIANQPVCNNLNLEVQVHTWMLTGSRVVLISPAKISPFVKNRACVGYCCGWFYG